MNQAEHADERLANGTAFVQVSQGPTTHTFAMLRITTMTAMVALLGVLVACTQTSAEPAAERSKTMVDQEAANSEHTVRRLFELINQGKLNQLGEVIAEGYVGPLGERGPAGFGAVVERLKSGVPDLHYELAELVAEGNRVAVSWVWRGKHTGTLNGFVASGKSVENTGMALFELSETKIVRASLETDRLGLLQQIGVLSPLVGGSRPNLRFHVDNFIVPEAAREEFEATMRRNMSFIRTLPGFVGHTALERTDGPTRFNITTFAIWKDQAALDAAVGSVRAYYEQIGFDGPKTLARWGAQVERGHFRAPPELQ